MNGGSMLRDLSPCLPQTLYAIRVGTAGYCRPVITREYFTRTAIAAQSWIAVLDLPSRTAIDRSPESRTAIQDYDEIAFAVLIAVLVAVLIAVLIVVFDF